MAAGDITYCNNLYAALKLIENATATNTKPSGATAGFDITGIFPSRPINEAGLVVKGACTAAQVMTATVRLWGYSPELAEWVPINAAASLAEVDADKLQYTEQVTLGFGFTRFYLEISAIAGGGATINAVLVIPRKDRLNS